MCTRCRSGMLLDQDGRIELDDQGCPLYCLECEAGIESELQRLARRLQSFADSLAEMDARAVAERREFRPWERQHYERVEHTFRFLLDLHDQLEGKLATIQSTAVAAKATEALG